MRKMTLLTALALMFSLFTVTAAIAGQGPGAGDGEQAGELLMTRRTTQTQMQDGECRVDDCQTGEMLKTQERTRVRDGECQGDEGQADQGSGGGDGMMTEPSGTPSTTAPKNSGESA